MRGSLISVNVGRPAVIGTAGDGPVLSAIGKAPVTGPVRVSGVNLDGDDQADRTVHGGPDKAVYAYATEDLAFWTAELGREVGPAAVGENLTTEGLDVSGAVVGERWRVGTTLLEVCQPRLPCFKLGVRFGDPRLPKRFGAARRPGAYLRILEEGALQAGDAVEVLDRPAHGVTVAEVAAAVLGDRSLDARALQAPQLAAMVRDFLAARSAA